MTDLRKAAEMALNALNIQTPLNNREFELRNSALEALRQALAEPEQEPVAIVNEGMGGIEWLSKPLPDDTPLYTAPPKREWVGLTDSEVEAWRGNYDFFDSALVREVEAKLKEKNT